MELEDPQSRAFLEQLYTLTDGDPDQQVSMYDLGDNLGLEKNQAGALAEALFIQGLAELKTLSGGLGITKQGILALGKKMTPGTQSFYALSDHLVLTVEDREAVALLLDEIKANSKGIDLSYDQMNVLVIDIKTIEVQLLSEKAKTAVVRELFISLYQSLKNEASTDLIDQLIAMAGIKPL